MERLQRQVRLVCRRLFDALIKLVAQFDVHRNKGKNRKAIPFVVVVQSALFDGYRRRVVVPLVRKSALGRVSHATFNPTFRIAGIAVVLHPLEIVSVPLEALGEHVGSLANVGNQITDSLDQLLTRSWG